jgi:hypothetical protein
VRVGTAGIEGRTGNSEPPRIGPPALNPDNSTGDPDCDGAKIGAEKLEKRANRRRFLPFFTAICAIVGQVEKRDAVPALLWF